MPADSTSTNRRLIAQIKGGLGNQLSILAAGLNWSRRTRCELRYDTSSYRRDSYYRFGFEIGFLCRFLGIEPAVASGAENRVGERLPLRLRLGLGRGTFLLAGYYQARRHLGPAVPDMAAALAAHAEALGLQQHPLWHEASAGPTVAVHFRRLHGVPLSGRAPHPHLAALGSDYYHAALAIVARHMGPMRILAFADDPAWLAGQDWLAEYDWVNVEAADPGGGSLLRLLLMARCRAIVAANSTLSWWAGLLRHASDPRALLVAPDMALWEPSITLGREWRCVPTAIPAGKFVHSSLPQSLRPPGLQQDF
jgi:hypothetical protein